MRGGGGEREINCRVCLEAMCAAYKCTIEKGWMCLYTINIECNVWVCVPFWYVCVCVGVYNNSRVKSKVLRVLFIWTAVTT